MRLGCLSVSTPLLFQSKILCLSLLFLLTTLPLSIYVSSSQSACLFQSPPILPSSKLFNYPRSYGEHKHALATTRSSCTSPVPFPGTKKIFSILHLLLNYGLSHVGFWWVDQRTRRLSRRSIIFVVMVRCRIPLFWGIWEGEERALQGISLPGRGDRTSVVAMEMVRLKSLVGSWEVFLPENLVCFYFLLFLISIMCLIFLLTIVAAFRIFEIAFGVFIE